MATGSLRDGDINDIITLHSEWNYEITDQARRSKRQRDPEHYTDPSEVLQQKATKRQRSLAATGSKSIRDIEIDMVYIEENLDVITDLASLRELLCTVEALWVSFESTHAKYIPGIKKPKRQRETEQRFTILQEKFSNIMGRCRQRLHLESPQGVKDHISTRSTISTRLSRASSGSSQKEKLRTVLLAKKKLELARARAKEEEEEARRNAQQQSKRELR